MLDTEYSRALYVQPGRIAGYRLRPFSLWQAFTLDFLDSPFTLGKRAPTIGDCAIALAVFRSRNRDGLRRVTAITGSKTIERCALARVLLFGAQRVADDIHAHIDAYSGYPETWQSPRKAGEAAASRTGAPWQWYVVSILASDYGMTLEAAWDTPVVAGAVLKAITSERNGGAGLVSVEELERQERVAAAKEAANG
jgi:hypothetical protein